MLGVEGRAEVSDGAATELTKLTMLNGSVTAETEGDCAHECSPLECETFSYLLRIQQGGLEPPSLARREALPD